MPYFGRGHNYAIFPSFLVSQKCSYQKCEPQRKGKRTATDLEKKEY